MISYGHNQRHHNFSAVQLTFEVHNSATLDEPPRGPGPPGDAPGARPTAEWIL